MPTVGIIGGGASGTLTAIHLLEVLRRPVRLVVFERCLPLGRGVAYGTEQDAHLLNVPAAHMSASSRRPGDFVAWLAAHGRPDAADDFVSRHLFGCYLEERLNEAVRRRADGTVVEVRANEVVEIEFNATKPNIVTRRGDPVAVDTVVLALGAGAPVGPASCRDLARTDRYIADPWQRGACREVAPADSVTLIGTGLTAVDVLLSLAAGGHRGPLHAFSRHGLFPHGHRHGSALPPCPLNESITAQTTARGLLRAVRSEVRSEARRGGDWRQVMNRLRPHTSALWQAMPEVERRRFLRHLERYWDIHRHRLAPTCIEVIEQMQATGQLRVMRGRLAHAEARPGGISLTVSRGRLGPHHWATAWLVNCTGPRYDLGVSAASLPAQLVAGGWARRGPAGLGLDVDKRGRVIDATGSTVPWLWSIGALRRGVLYETTAVPELREQARKIAHEIDARLGAPPLKSCR